MDCIVEQAIKLRLNSGGRATTPQGAEKRLSQQFTLLFALLCCCLLCCFLPGQLDAVEQQQQKTYSIGVLAIRGKNVCRQSWKKTADYLTSRIPGAVFTIVPLDHTEINDSIAQGEVDFILTNSSSYVELEYRYGINRIATLKEKRHGGVYSSYGGVIFYRADRTDISSFADLRGKRFAAVSENSLGGWQMCLVELLDSGVDPYRDFRLLTFLGTHDSVVSAVENGTADAGSVRTNILEELDAAGRIQLSDFKVLRPEGRKVDDVSYLLTTREYPDWPMARVKHTSNKVAAQVAIALLQMDESDKAALDAGCAGWTIPLNYQPVHELMKRLHLGPYAELGEITLLKVVREYTLLLSLICLTFIILFFFTFKVMKLNRAIQRSQQDLLEEIEEHKMLDEELQEAKELAEEATRAKSQFLANMSHEIRTPMNGIIAATDLALEENLSPAVDEYLNIVQSSSYSLLGIINDILDFSKIEAGQMELKERVFKLDDMLDQVIDLFGTQASEKGIELMVDVERNVPTMLFGDSMKLQQIVNNLISNAIKFTLAGGTILISVQEGESRGKGEAQDFVELLFSVRDTGIGIDQEYQRRLFEPFSQGDSSATRQHEGTGLGLSICKKFVAMMNGEIAVESELDKGSTFTFSVMLRRAGTMLPGAYEFPEDIKGGTALVVDDLYDSRLIIGKMLASFGFNVETCSSGAEALQRLLPERMVQAPVDLIMMDWKMHELDGITVSKRIRQELNLSVPIIMMTAFGKDLQRNEAEKIGINGFLIKPIFQSTLFDAVMDAFGKGGNLSGQTKHNFTTRASIYKKHLTGYKILLVEDNLTNQQVATAILQKAGVIVTVAENGRVALEKLKQEQFDAVLMDIQMPIMSGFEATKAIREMPDFANLPIIAMTAHAMKGDEEKCLEAGMNGYITKPINQERLFLTLRRFLHSRECLVTPVKQEPVVAAGLLPEPESAKAAENLALVADVIDVDNILELLGIDAWTMEKILISFYRDNLDTGQNLGAALEKGDLPLLRKIAHKLKGSGGNIGSNEMADCAEKLEMICRDAEDHPVDQKIIEGLVDKLQQILAGVLEKLKLLADDEDQKAMRNPESQSGVSLSDAVDQLLLAIEQFDPEEIEKQFGEVESAGQDSRVEQALIEQLGSLISGYDYASARQVAEKIREAL